MAKPILVCYLPSIALLEENVYQITRAHLEHSVKNEYHVIVVPVITDKEIQVTFQCFNAKDATEIDLDKLREEIKQKMQK